MKRTTYTDRHILNYLDAHFVCAQVNVERLPALARKYKIESNPTIWLLDSAGKPLTHVDGYLGPERLLAILQYVATEAYTTLSYQDWKDGKRP